MTPQSVSQIDIQILIHEAKKVLAANDMGGWTRPTTNGLYPHQWLWDSFFISIGQRHYDVERAMAEVRSPFRAQWKNGMLPHIIFGNASGYHAGPELWRDKRSPNAPPNIETSGITQPPMAAEAVVRIGRMLRPEERRTWYQEIYPKLLRYHQWFYAERNPRGDGLPVIVLSWETGMDNTPPWMDIMHRYALTLRARLAKRGKNISRILERTRKDTKAVPASERIATIDLFAVYGLIKSLRHLRYDSSRVMRRHRLRIVDVAFSCILIRANQLLEEIATEIGEELPADIKHAMHVAPYALETLWDDETQQYYNRDDITGKLIKISSISNFMPLYAQSLSPERTEVLVQQLNDPSSFATRYPIPSTPINSPHFKPSRYWQGPTWINMNWLLIDGLKRNNQTVIAERLRQSTIDLITRGGLYEYFSPLDARPHGAKDFSWTAALLIDLLANAD